MSEKNRTKRKMFDEGMQFTSLEHAKQVSEKEGKKIKFKLICAGISVLTTVVWVIEWLTGVGQTALGDVLGVVMIIGWIAMFVCTNIRYFKYLWNSIVIAWFLIPIFPIDLMCCIVGAVVFFGFSLYAPVVPCLLALRQSHLTKREADEYISSVENSDGSAAVEQF